MYRPAEETGEVRALSHTPPRPPGFGDPKRDAWRSWEMGKNGGPGSKCNLQLLFRNARIASGNGTVVSPQAKAAKGSAEKACVVALTNVGRFGRTNRSIEQTRAAKCEVMRQRDGAGVVVSTDADQDCGWLATAMLPQYSR